MKTKVAVDQPEASAAPEMPLVAPPKLRRRPLLIAFGVVLVVIGAIVMWYVVTMLKDTVQVVASRVDVPRGQILQLNDLTTVEVRPDPNLKTIPASELESLVGMRVLSDLSAGGLVAPAAVTAKLLPEPGYALIGAPLTLGQQMPGVMPRIGQPVSLVPTSVAESDGVSLPASYAAVVVAVTPVSDTQIALTVSVPVVDAPVLVRLAASNGLAVYFESEG
ncbi:MAG: SAF domain-containing protein [Propionibacteriaceae bacterium]|nr:SAF domain-containing protein [Propionibacteriaceae bacterium]